MSNSYKARSLKILNKKANERPNLILNVKSNPKKIEIRKKLLGNYRQRSLESRYSSVGISSEDDRQNVSIESVNLKHFKPELPKSMRRDSNVIKRPPKPPIKKLNFKTFEISDNHPVTSKSTEPDYSILNNLTVNITRRGREKLTPTIPQTEKSGIINMHRSRHFKISPRYSIMTQSLPYAPPIYPLTKSRFQVSLNPLENELDEYYREMSTLSEMTFETLLNKIN